MRADAEKKLYGLTNAELNEIEGLFSKTFADPGNPLPRDVKTHLLDSPFIFGEPTDESLFTFIGILAKRPDILNSVSSIQDKALPSDGLTWGNKFVLDWLKQFRLLVCEKSPQFRDEYKSLGSATQASILAAVSLRRHFIKF
jgi:hypothetical protein